MVQEMRHRKIGIQMTNGERETILGNNEVMTPFNLQKTRMTFRELPCVCPKSNFAPREDPRILLMHCMKIRGIEVERRHRITRLSVSISTQKRINLRIGTQSEEHTTELQSQFHLV